MMVQLRERSWTATSEPFSIRTWYDQNQRFVVGSDCSARKLTATRTAIPRVTATLGKSMASASVFTGRSLGESTRAAQPVDEPFTRFRHGARAVDQDIAQEEMARKVEALCDLWPRRRPAFA